MTKKQFSNEVSFHNYGKRDGKIALYYDYKSYDGVHGYKYMVYSHKSNATKKELLDIFYQWVNGLIDQVPYYIGYKYAINDTDRFKVKLTL
jgi:hypothetical protein